MNSEPKRLLDFRNEGFAREACTVDPEAPSRPLVAREWLVTNGLGGYAAGTVSGVITRRFHGYLVSALPAPLGRTMMLNHLSELVLDEQNVAQLGAQPHPDVAPSKLAKCTEFELDQGLPVWRFAHDQWEIERRVWMPYRQNTVHVSYTLLRDDRAASRASGLCLEIEPWLAFRPHEGPVDAPMEGTYSLSVLGERYEVRCDASPALPPLRLWLHGAHCAFTIEGKRIHNVRYQIEASRGYDSEGDLYSPGNFRMKLELGKTVTLIASTEEIRSALALSPSESLAAEKLRRTRLRSGAAPALREGLGAELVFAADQFLIVPAGRLEDTARAQASGDEVRTVIAGYHWFTDWGRDTMISLPGLTLATGRIREAGYILRTFARYVRDGLIPNMFPEGRNGGLYHTADATMWFFHAVDSYLTASGDRELLAQLMPTLIDIIEHHIEGTRFGIGVDPQDGLLRQGAEGYQLTWMDAKVGDLVVTPRRGKAVEINALWYNALRLVERWTGDSGRAEKYRALADRVRASFQTRFWNASAQHLYDVVDGESGDDASFRPNQIFAVSLPNAVLAKDHWKAVVDGVKEKLLTPVGLRSLAPESTDYRAKYFGNLYDRDLAYHQGTVWGWLIGPFVDAFVKVYPERSAEARTLLNGFAEHLDSACVGSISEIFDAEEPYVPRGCCAQAWSVAEVLRCVVKLSAESSR